MKLRILWDDIRKSRFGKNRFLALLGAGLLGILGLWLLNKDAHPVPYSASSVLFTVSIFEIIVLALDFTPSFRRRRRFRMMFYGHNKPSPTLLVFPEFVPDADVFPQGGIPTKTALIPLPRSVEFSLSAVHRLPFIRPLEIRRKDTHLQNVSFRRQANALTKPF